MKRRIMSMIIIASSTFFITVLLTFISSPAFATTDGKQQFSQQLESLRAENRALAEKLKRQLHLFPKIIKAEVLLATREISLKEAATAVENAKKDIQNDRDFLNRQYELIQKEATSTAKEDLQAEYDRRNESAEMVKQNLDALEEKQLQLEKEVNEARKSLRLALEEYDGLAQ